MTSPLRLLCLFLLCLLRLDAWAAQETAPVSQRLAVELDPAGRTLRGHADITVQGGAGFEVVLNARFAVETATLDGVALTTRPPRAGGLHHWSIPAGAATRTLALAWRGTLAAPAGGMEHRDTLGQREPTAGPQGSFLPAATGWYPRIVRDDALLLHDYRLTLTLPEGQRGLVAGTRNAETTADGRVVAQFEFPHPADGIDLMAGPYRVSEQGARSIDGRSLALRTYFHPELEALAPAYLESVADYLALYERWIGPYPFTTFSVVSSPTPTGFGMPSLTYLGIEVLKLPFIRATSLGHEVLHNWWGNGVYPDYAGGNWSEGLTTFMADYAYAARASEDKARTMRLGWLRDLAGIPDGADRPLAAFTSRHHGISQAVGYGKAAMLFEMLRERIGAPAFDRGVQRLWRTQRFRVAGWDALRAAFEAESGEDLGVFFAQWLQRAGLPEVALEAARRDADGLTVTLTQRAPPYVLDVPLRVTGPAGETLRRVRLEQARQSFRLESDGAATRVTLDPDSRLLRRLGRDEAPPLLRELQLDRAGELLLLGDAPFGEAAQALAARLLDHPPRTRRADAAPREAPLLVIGAAPAITEWLARHGLPPAPEEIAGRGDARMWTARLASGAPLAIVAADSPAALAAATRPLPHYRQQSWLVLEQGRALARGVWPARAMSRAVAGD